MLMSLQLVINRLIVTGVLVAALSITDDSEEVCHRIIPNTKESDNPAKFMNNHIIIDKSYVLCFL